MQTVGIVDMLGEVQSNKFLALLKNLLKIERKSLNRPFQKTRLLRYKFANRIINIKKKYYLCTTLKMVVVAQLVRASDCGSEGRRFESGLPPKPRTSGVFYFVLFHHQNCYSLAVRSLLQLFFFTNFQFPENHRLSFYEKSY